MPSTTSVITPTSTTPASTSHSAFLSLPYFAILQP
jgi:hypothetical protein